MTLTKLLFLALFAVLVFLSTEMTAQSVAAFSSIKGTVTIHSDGSSVKARKSSKLQNGDRVKTGKNGRAVIIYYSGKEVVLRNNASHTVRAKKSKKNSRTGGIGKVVSDLFWGKEKSKSVAGTTRWQGEDGDSTLQVAYPMRSKIVERQPVFRWHDLKGADSYTLTIYSEISDFRFSKVVTGTWFEYPVDAPTLKEEEPYVWSVADSSGRVSNEISFSIIHSEEKNNLAEDLNELRTNVADENIELSDFALSALYYRYNLFHIALQHAKNAAVDYSEMPQLYTLMETVNLRLGNQKAARENAMQFAKVSVEE